MNSSKPTIGIYGIQDTHDSEYPQYVHDHSVAIMHKGEIIHHLQQERLSRKKYDNTLHTFLYQILKDKKLLNMDADVVFVDNIVGRAFISREGNIRFEAPLHETLSNSFETGNLYWLDKHKRGYIVNHELAHIYSTVPFFGTFKKESLLIHFDGGASKGNFSAWYYNDQQLSLIENHWKLQYLSSFFNANALTFGIIGSGIQEQNTVPGKLMGLASYGKYEPDLEAWLKHNNYFSNIWKSKKCFFDKVKKDFQIQLYQLDQKNAFIQDIVATFHHVFERETILKIKQLQEKTRAKYLYYSGGSALNIKLNSRILNELHFKDLFIPPCTNDSGLALGAATLIEQAKGHSIKIHSPYINNWNIEDYKVEYTMETIQETVRLILQKKVIGICNGLGEIGPRALGNRSIIAMANSKELSRKISMQIKKREWYRPVAPIMLSRNASHFTGKKKVHHLAHYMLLEYAIPERHKNTLKGVVHVDGSCRIQTLDKRDSNPFMWDLLEYLEQKHNIKALINTSFNARGEPVVHTMEDALNSAKRMKLDAVLLNGKIRKLE